MHHDVNRREHLLRCPCAAQADVAVRIDGERGHEVVTVRVVHETLLKERAVARPDLAPEYSAPGVEGGLRGITGEDAAAVGEDARRAAGLVGPDSVSRGGLNR